jgi:hypothetical protein
MTYDSASTEGLSVGTGDENCQVLALNFQRKFQDLNDPRAEWAKFCYNNRCLK